MVIPLEILILLALLSFGASLVNGGLGYGYSSLSTPLALLALVNRIINPVYVGVEACVNTAILGFSGKENIKATFRRSLPVVIFLVPGILVGSFVLATLSSTWLKLVVYAAILPLVLLQAAGLRRPIRSEQKAAAPLGVGIGLLYSVTTISGPPIALFWNNQGLEKQQFRAAIAQVRIAESYLTAISYYFLGLFTVTSLQIFSWIAPPVLIGIPLGMFVVKKVGTETFRRVCMSFDAWIVGFGLAVVIGNLFGLLDFGYSVWAIDIGIDAWLLYRFFTGRRLPFQPQQKVSVRPPSPEVPLEGT